MFICTMRCVYVMFFHCYYHFYTNSFHIIIASIFLIHSLVIFIDFNFQVLHFVWLKCVCVPFFLCASNSFSDFLFILLCCEVTAEFNYELLPLVWCDWNSHFWITVWSEKKIYCKYDMVYVVALYAFIG